MNQSWIEQIESGQIDDIKLPELTIKYRDQQWTGSGRLTWHQGKRVELKGATDGGDYLITHYLDRAPGKPGDLLSDDDLIHISAKTHDGADATIDSCQLDGYEIRSESETVHWDLESRRLRLSRPISSTARMISILLGPSPFSWTRNTFTEVTNPYFGSRQSSRDWLSAASSIGTVAARQVSNDYFEVKLEVASTDSTVSLSTDQIVISIAQAFGFVLGRHVFACGTHEHGLSEETRRLSVRRKSPSGFGISPPLGNGIAYLNGVESLVGKAIDFFLTEKGKAAIDHLAVCWDTTENDWSTRLAVTGIALEGLLKLIPKRSSKDKELVAHVEKTKMLILDARNRGDLTDSFFRRIEGMLNSMGQRRPVDILTKWEKNSVLGVSDDDVKAFKAIRNSGAHATLIGMFPEREKLQALIRQHKLVENLMNRVLLQLIGYKGEYVDYARGWFECEFPAATPDDL